MSPEVRCPECGSDEIGVNVLVVECRDIHEPSLVYAYEDVGTEDRIGGCKYTCICGHDFNACAASAATP